MFRLDDDSVYGQALLQKRLLVPVVIAAGTATFNAVDAPFDFNYGPVLLGFLSYKAERVCTHHT